MKKNIYTILLIIWIGIIFLFSNQPAKDSLNLTTSGIDKVIESTSLVIDQNDKEKWIDKLIKPVRKCAHFIEFLILGILTFLFFKKYKFSYLRIILYSIILCILIASLDEIHQIFVPGRTALLTDVIIDTLGSITGIIVCYLIIKFHIYRHKESDKIRT